jgi:iron complex outermembrane recepter protein
MRLLQKKSLLLLVFICCGSMLFSQTTVTGKVTSAEYPGGVPSANVQEQGTNNTVSTGKNGEYSITVKNSKAVLLFSYAGMASQSVSVAGKSQVDIDLSLERSALNEVVVTSNRQPVRKLETSTAVEIINAKALKITKPESIAEAITAAPGLYVNTSQGRRGGIVTRGFPDGGNPLGGLDYTAILIDGLPSFGSTGRLPEAGFGFDANVDKVEVVRGSTATLFGRASAAGAVNIISKTGGTKGDVNVRFTSYNNVFSEGPKQLNYRMDYNGNGPLSKNKRFRYNIGGWFMNDKGFKNTGYNDKGYQVRGNIDYLAPVSRSTVRLYFLRADYVFQNLTDVPADINTMGLAGKWKNYQTIQNFKGFYNLNYTVYETGGGFPTRRVTTNGTDSITRNVGNSINDNTYGKNWHVGTAINYQSKKSSFSFEERLRFQWLNSGTKYSFGLPSFYLSNNEGRLLLDGDAKDKDVINEFRMKFKMEDKNTKHSFVMGHFFSNTHLMPTTYSFFHQINPSNPDSLKFVPLFPGGAPWAGSVLFPRGTITRVGNYTERVSSIFIGDEIKVKSKLTLNVSFRYDWVTIDMKERKKPFDSTIVRNVTHKDWSGSIGFNYLLTQQSAVYGNINKAFRAPDYTAYTSLEFISFTNRTLLRAPDGIKKNENIINMELGYRNTLGDFSFDIAAFHTKINNRLASIFENGIVVSKPFGSNRIFGSEISLSYNPVTLLPGLSVRTNITIQKATFSEFKVPIARGGVLGAAGFTASTLNVDINGNLFGNTLINEGSGNYSIDVKDKKLPGVPSVIWNSSIVYSHKYFGLDFSSNFNGKRFVDATNVLKYKDLMVMNAGAYVRFGLKNNQDVRIGIQAKNLANQKNIQNIPGLTASDLALAQKQRTPTFTSSTNIPIWGQGYVQLPRRVLVYIAFDF